MTSRLYKRLLKICEQFQDEGSKWIFFNRARYSLTGDIDYLNKFIESLPERQYLDELQLPGGYIFGCGIYGKTIYEHLDKKWFAFVDNKSDLWGGEYCGLKVIPPQKLTADDAPIFLAVKYHGEEIKCQLLELGVSEDRIIDVAKILIDMGNRQYFDLPELQHSDDEVFVDAGCLNGMTTKNFIKWSNNVYKHVYCFEPDPYNAHDCTGILKDLIESNKVTIINKAVSNKNGMISFSSHKNGFSHIGEGNMTVQTVAIDDILRNEKVSFIKMDVEGAEYSALQGARRIICECRPKLAISVYHLKEDIFDIPELLLSYHPDYKLYLRHYSPFYEETVLYAI